MLTVLLIIYLSGAAATSFFAALQTGKEQAYMRVLAPHQMMSVNWINNFFQSVLWFSYWAQYFSFKSVKYPTKMEAADFLGIPRENVQ